MILFQMIIEIPGVLKNRTRQRKPGDRWRAHKSTRQHYLDSLITFFFINHPIKVPGGILYFSFNKK